MAGVIGYGAYVAGNQPFINLWVGAENFTGQGVTIMIALGLMPMGSQSFLYRLLVGTGDIAGPSYLMLAESLLVTENICVTQVCPAVSCGFETVCS